MKRVVVTDHNFETLALEEAAASDAGAEFASQRVAEIECLPEFVAGANVALIQFAPISCRVMESLAPGAVLIRYGVGYDNIDIQAARKLGLKVAYVPDYCTNEVAEHAAAAVLTLLRKLPKLDAECRAGMWNSAVQAAPVHPFDQTTVGLLGLGRIGRALVHRLKNFGFNFIVHDPYLDSSVAEGIGVNLVDLETLVRESDVISLHSPLTTETYHVVDAEFLASMRSEAVLVNVARGALVDTNALADALNAGQIAAAALDVFETEPLPKEHGLWKAANLTVSPHAAWYSTSSLERLQRLAAEEVGRALRGEPLRCTVPTG